MTPVVYNLHESDKTTSHRATEKTHRATLESYAVRRLIAQGNAALDCVRAEEWLLASILVMIGFVHTLLALPINLFQSVHETLITYPTILAGLGFFSVGFVALATWAILGQPDNFGKRTLRLVRDFLPFAFMYVIYESIHTIGPSLHGITYDTVLSKIDLALFRSEAYVDFPIAVFRTPHYQIIAYYLAFCYSVVFVVYWGMGFLLRGIRARLVFRRYMLSVLMTSLFAYFSYIIVPAQGPYESFVRSDIAAHFGHWQSYAGALSIANFADNIRIMHPGGQAAFDAFPSLHTAWAILMIGFTARHVPKLLWLIGPWAIGTVLGTIYFQQHYLIDLVAGIPLAAAGCFAAHLLLETNGELPVQNEIR